MEIFSGIDSHLTSIWRLRKPKPKNFKMVLLINFFIRCHDVIVTVNYLAQKFAESIF